MTYLVPLKDAVVRFVGHVQETPTWLLLIASGYDPPVDTHLAAKIVEFHFDIAFHELVCNPRILTVQLYGC